MNALNDEHNILGKVQALMRNLPLGVIRFYKFEFTYHGAPSQKDSETADGL